MQALGERRRRGRRRRPAMAAAGRRSRPSERRERPRPGRRAAGRPPARWLSATVIGAAAPPRDRRAVGRRASIHAGSAPIQNGPARRRRPAPRPTPRRAARRGRRGGRASGRGAGPAGRAARRRRRRPSPPSSRGSGAGDERGGVAQQRGRPAPASTGAALEDRAAADHDGVGTRRARGRRRQRVAGTARTPWRPAVSARVAAGDDDVVVGEGAAERRAERLVAGVTLPEGADEQHGRHRAPPRTARAWRRRRPASAVRRPARRSSAGARRARSGLAASCVEARGERDRVERRGQHVGRADAAGEGGDSSTGVPWARASASAPLDANGFG